MARVCPADCLHAEECAFAYGDGDVPDCGLMEEESPDTDNSDVV